MVLWHSSTGLGLCRLSTTLHDEVLSLSQLSKLHLFLRSTCSSSEQRPYRMLFQQSPLGAPVHTWQIRSLSTMCRRTRRVGRLLQRPLALLRLQSWFHCTIFSIRKRNDSSYWSNGTKGLYLVSCRTIYSMARPLSETRPMWTMECGPDITSWTLLFSLSPISIWITLHRRFSATPFILQRKAGPGLLITLCRRTDCWKGFNPFCLRWRQRKV